MLAERHRAIAEARDLVRLDPVIIDTETTGMDDDDQVVELAAADLQGNAHRALNDARAAAMLLQAMAEADG